MDTYTQQSVLSWESFCIDLSSYNLLLSVGYKMTIGCNLDSSVGYKMAIGCNLGSSVGYKTVIG